METLLTCPPNTSSKASTSLTTNPYPPNCLHSDLGRTESLNCASPNDEQSRTSTTKRASRAGSRSVRTLSKTQLERKRESDRRTQRKTREKTKNQIKSLENIISELRQSQEASEKTIQSTRQRNKELEEENIFIRMKLNEAGLAIYLPSQSRFEWGSTTAEHATDKSILSRPQDPSLIAMHHPPQATHVSGTVNQRPDSTAASHGFSGSHLDPPGLWPQQQQNKPSYESYSILPGFPLAVCGTSAFGSNTSRCHEGAQVVATVAGDIHTAVHNTNCLSHKAPPHSDSTQWLSTKPQHHRLGTGQQPHAQYSGQVQPFQQHVAIRQQIPDSHAPLNVYPPAQQTQQQDPAHRFPRIPPQSELHDPSAYSRPSSYTTFMPETQSFVRRPQNHTVPIHSNEYPQPQVNLPRQSIPDPSYQILSAEQGCPPQLSQETQTHYRDDFGLAFSMAHLPPV